MNRLALAALAILLGAAPPTPAPDAPVRSVTIDYISVTYRVLGATIGGNPIIAVKSSTSDPVRHSLYCIDLGTALRFRLVDGSGKTVPISQYGDTFGLAFKKSGLGPGAFAPYCGPPEANEGEFRIVLRNWYPHVPHGLYALSATLTLEAVQARFAPVTVRL